MDNFQKQEIQRLLQEKVNAAKTKGMSQKTFANTLIGVSEANVINVLSGKWANISDAMLENPEKLTTPIRMKLTSRSGAN